MDYLKELEAIQIWIKAVAGLNSFRLRDAKPSLARPVILFETPARGKVRNLDRYRYVVPVKQFGKLFVSNLEEADRIQEELIKDLEEKVNILPLYDKGVKIPRVYLKEVVIDFREAEGLDIPFTITYETTYSRTRPADAPPATYVGNKVITRMGP